MSINKFCCEFCGKIFTKKTDHKKHSYICEFLNTSKRDDIILEEEHTNIPSNFQLYKIILEMGKKINLLEEKIKKSHILPNENIDILSTLNSSSSLNLYLNTPLFIEWIKTLIITDNDLNVFIENDFITTVSNIFINSIKIFGDLPFKCFEQKKNTIYIYSNDSNDSNDNTKLWKKINKEELNCIIKTIHKKLFQHLYNWKKINIEKFTQNHKMEEIHSKNIIKLLNINEIDQVILSGKIKSSLFSAIIKS
jgi:hypothetical protein